MEMAPGQHLATASVMTEAAVVAGDAARDADDIDPATATGTAAATAMAAGATEATGGHSARGEDKHPSQHSKKGRNFFEAFRSPVGKKDCQSPWLPRPLSLQQRQLTPVLAPPPKKKKQMPRPQPPPPPPRPRNRSLLHPLFHVLLSVARRRRRQLRS